MKTKIIATLGPATDAQDMVRSLIEGGVDIFRLNLAHGSHEEHRRRVALIRKYAKEFDRFVGIMFDLGGQKLRIGSVAEATMVKKGDRLHLVADVQKELATQTSAGSDYELLVNYPAALRQIPEGADLYLADGAIKLQVIAASQERVEAQVLAGGELRSGMGLAAAGISFDLPALTQKDKNDIAFAAEQGADFIAVSSVRSAEDMDKARTLLGSHASVALCAKIETARALDHFDEILDASDAIMVARGDLGFAIPIERVPQVQEDLIARSIRAAKPVITATQLLDSMIYSARPTRAEVNDIAQLVAQGTDALLLSDETARGQYPIECVDMLRRVVDEAERNAQEQRHPGHTVLVVKKAKSIDQAICDAAVWSAAEVRAKVIAVFTESGQTARFIARNRIRQPIIAFSPYERVLKQLTVVRGVIPKRIHSLKTLDEMFDFAREILRALPFLAPGDHYVIVIGSYPGRSGGTDSLKIEKI